MIAISLLIVRMLREPALGSATDPWRTAQAWHRCRADHRGKIHGQEKAAAIAGLEDLSAQSCRRHCVDGFVRSPDDLISAVVWTSDPAAFPPRACVAGDRTPERKAYGWHPTPQYIVRNP